MFEPRGRRRPQIIHPLRALPVPKRISQTTKQVFFPISFSPEGARDGADVEVESICEVTTFIVGCANLSVP